MSHFTRDVHMFYKSTSDVLKGAMRWVDNNVRKE